MPDSNPAPTGPRHLDLTARATALLQRLGPRDREMETIVQAGGVSVLLMAFAPGAELKEHSAPGQVLIQCVRGGVNLVAGGDRYALSAGELLLLPPGTRHDVRAPGNAVIMVTIFERG